VPPDAPGGGGGRLHSPQRPPVRGARLPELGARGEGWAASQAALLLAVALSALVGLDWPDGLEVPARVLGAALLAAGIALVLAGSIQLGSALTPLPAPRPGASLRASGVYGLVRHPIYGGVILVALGWTTVFATPLGLVLTVLLVAFFELKARREEAWLAERHPEYEAYRERTPRRLLPWVY
jgi:protein-S-isoprenylcysteine O-methyltransferase Ste14